MNSHSNSNRNQSAVNNEPREDKDELNFEEVGAIYEDLFANIFDNDNLATLQRLAELTDFSQLATADLLLNKARAYYWNYPEKSKELDTLCATIKKTMPAADRPPRYGFPRHAQPVDSATFHNQLFGEEEKSAPQSKEEAIKLALAQIASLLAIPEISLQYLDFLNQDFLRYYQEKYQHDFPEIDPDTYQFKIIDDTYYPIPNESYTGIKKQSALQEFLILKFRQYGIANKACKWNGFIPKAVADEMLIAGDFVMESRVGSGLFHNKIAHMLQQAIIIYAMEKGEINLKYRENNQTYEITIKDILLAMLTVNQHGKEANLWMIIRDTRVHHTVSFSDPFRLGSIIMFNGKELGINALSTYLVDTFCKGYIKQLHAHNEVAAFSDLTADSFAEKMTDVRTELFNVPSYLLKFSVLNDLKKRRNILEQHSEVYSITEKEYKPNENFVPRKCR